MRRTRQEPHPPADNDDFFFSSFFIVYTLKTVKSKFLLNFAYLYICLFYFIYLFTYNPLIYLQQLLTYLLWNTVQRLFIFLLIYLQTTRIYCHYYLFQILLPPIYLLSYTVQCFVYIFIHCHYYLILECGPAA